MATRRTTPNAAPVRTLTNVHEGDRELTREEELVVRMRQGLGESPVSSLPRRGADFAETRARLALMEAALLAEMHDAGPLADSPAPQVVVDSDVKSRILDKLSKL